MDTRVPRELKKGDLQKSRLSSGTDSAQGTEYLMRCYLSPKGNPATLTSHPLPVYIIPEWNGVYFSRFNLDMPGLHPEAPAARVPSEGKSGRVLMQVWCAQHSLFDIYLTSI